MPSSPTSKSLDDLSSEYFELLKTNNPLFATSLGDRHFDERLPDITFEGRRRIQAQYQSIVERCRNISERDLSNADKLTRNALLVDATSQADYLSCGLDEWTVDPLGGGATNRISELGILPACPNA